MTDTVAVVKPHYLIEEAYNMGYKRFKDAETEGEEMFDLAPFKGSAEWANSVSPQLRAMAGLADNGPGTYQVDRQVASIKPGCEEDEPAEAVLRDARAVYRELVDAFDKGAYDAAEGNEKAPPAP